MMIFGLIPQELHEQLLDLKNYQNRTNGVEQLKNILFGLDLKPVPSDSIVEFIHFLRRLLDDSNFKVLYGTLQVINLLIQKLDYNVDKYFKQLACVALKTLGDTRAVTRNEYMNVFRQLTRIVGPQKVLDLVIGHLRHKNSRVREDVINIITATMLTHPRKDFNIPSLCFEVAPYLADSKKKVRHAALELFAVFDHCLDTGKKQPLMKAVDRVELNGDVEGLMTAVQARRARHILPRLSSDGMVEYALVIPKPGQRRSPQFGSGADLEWVLNGGRISSARSIRTEPDSDRLYHGYGSLGSLVDDLPLQRRIVSAGKGKNKLPWERSSLPSTVNTQPCSAPKGKSSDQVISEDCLSHSRKLSPETYVPSFGSAEPHKPLSSRRESPRRLRRSGSLDLDPDIFKSTNFSDAEGVVHKAHLLPGTSSFERTFSNPSAQGTFLLPSYPLATLPGGRLTPTLSRRRADSSLSMSNTWPNKRESSPQRRDPSPWKDISSEFSSSRCSPQPLRASLVSSSSTSSFRQALSGMRNVLPVSPSPGLPLPERGQSQNGQRSSPLAPSPSSLQDHLSERNLHLDLDHLSLQDQDQEEDPLDRQEMLNSLRSLRCSAAKKKAKVSLSGSGSDPDSPDSAMKLELALDSPSHNSPTVTSPASESGLSSLYSPPNATLNGTKTSPGNSASSSTKPHIARVPSAKLRSSVSMDFSALQGFPLRDKITPEVSVVGQRVTYSNGPMEPEEEDRTTEYSPPPSRQACREPIRALRPAKGSQSYSNRNSPPTDMPEGVVGRGVFDSVVLSSRPGVAMSMEQGDCMTRLPSDPPAGIYGHAVPGNHLDPDDSPDTEVARDKEKVRMTRFARDKMRQHRLEQQEGQPALGDRQRADRMRLRLRQVQNDMATEDTAAISNDLHLNGGMGTSTKADSLQDQSHTSPQGPQSPIKCFSPPHQPSPPTVPPNPRSTQPRLRRAASLSRARLSLSHSSDEMSPGTPSQKRDLTEQPELRPFSKPELALTQSFKLLNSDDWEKKIEGLTFLRGLTHYHSDILLNRLHDVCLALIQEVRNLRSGVSRVAVGAMGELYTALQKGMDQELEGTAKALLQKAGETNAFIRQDVDAALDSMVQHCTPTRSLNALLTSGLSHLNSVVRKCAGHHMANLMENIGAARLLSGGKDLTDRILPAVTKLAQDSSQEARYQGRRMLLFLSPHRDFDKMLEKYIPAKDLAPIRDTIFTLKTKGLGEMPQDTPSARGRHSHPGSGTVRASSLNREPLKVVNRESGQYNGRPQAHSIADKTEYIKQLTALLGSKDFRERIKGIDQLMVDCEHNPNMVIGSIFPVFDAFKARLQESNSKVNLYALESLQKIVTVMKDNLAQVVYILVPAIVDNHLNSKNNAIYTAAIGAIHALIQNLDNTLLLQPFCTKAQFLSGKAKVDLIEKVADLVTELYPRKPQVVEQKVLPLLWHLLGTSSHSGTVHGRGGSVRGATVNLCQALYTHMGPWLAECATSQPANVHKGLNELLRTLSYS
ncbi:TOG array regulator of axonemal microtubules protein 1-like isoform X1 [Coregonus clupeaformis]|uniref:TOG array regulator of axonemal microtubules protein 1-like isoform X1 n=1 Tax=Coregonus clupeaformis TaxID=59861 RepID=UPI001BDFA2D9|nr:TOG array regulator of axonemal microtubules protein 1-like isoform X1 [Coregonus clupeaformis]